MEHLKMAKRFWGIDKWLDFIKDRFEVNDEELEIEIAKYRENSNKIEKINKQ